MSPLECYDLWHSAIARSNPPFPFFAPTDIWHSSMSDLPASINLHADLYSQAAKNQHPANVLAFVDALEHRLANVEDMGGLAVVFQQMEVHQEYGVAYSREDLKLLIASRDLSLRLSAHLTIANELAIQCAPILVRQISSRDPDLHIVATHEPGFSDGLDQYPNLATMRLRGLLDPTALHCFMDEVSKLFRRGFINESIVDDPGSLIVNPRSGLIYATVWTSLIKSNETNWDEYSAEVAAAIGLIPRESPFW